MRWVQSSNTGCIGAVAVALGEGIGTGFDLIEEFCFTLIIPPMVNMTMTAVNINTFNLFPNSSTPLFFYKMVIHLVVSHNDAYFYFIIYQNFIFLYILYTSNDEPRGLAFSCVEPQ